MANGTTKDMIAKSLDSIRRSHAVLQRLVASRSQDEEILAAFRLEIEVLNAQLKEITQKKSGQIIH
jgi:hypothetical protein